MEQFAKLTAAEQTRLDQLRSSAETRVRNALTSFLRVVTSDAVLRRILQLLEVGDTDGVLRIVDQSIVTTSGVFTDIFTDTGKDLTREVVDRLLQEALTPPPEIRVTFNPEHPEAVALMNRNKLEFVREYTKKQREATRVALAEALRIGAGPIETARIIRDSLGLTAYQQSSVYNFRRLLEMGSRDALERDLRDRRFDGSVARAASGERALTAEQIDRMVERYRQRFLMYRSEVIARTETTKIVAQARHNAVRQVMEQVGIKDNEVVRTWNTSLDGRERPTHHEMNAQEVVGMDSYYTSPSGAQLKYPGDPAAPADEIIQCRCVETFRFTK